MLEWCAVAILICALCVHKRKRPIGISRSFVTSRRQINCGRMRSHWEVRQPRRCTNLITRKSEDREHELSLNSNTELNTTPSTRPIGNVFENVLHETTVYEWY